MVNTVKPIETGDESWEAGDWEFEVQHFVQKYVHSSSTSADLHAFNAKKAAEATRKAAVTAELATAITTATAAAIGAKLAACSAGTHCRNYLKFIIYARNSTSYNHVQMTLS